MCPVYMALHHGVHIVWCVAKHLHGLTPKGTHWCRCVGIAMAMCSSQLFLVSCRGRPVLRQPGDDVWLPHGPLDENLLDVPDTSLHHCTCKTFSSRHPCSLEDHPTQLPNHNFHQIVHAAHQNYPHILSILSKWSYQTIHIVPPSCPKPHSAQVHCLQ